MSKHAAIGNYNKCLVCRCLIARENFVCKLHMKLLRAFLNEKMVRSMMQSMFEAWMLDRKRAKLELDEPEKEAWK